MNVQRAMVAVVGGVGLLVAILGITWGLAAGLSYDMGNALVRELFSGRFLVVAMVLVMGLMYFERAQEQQWRALFLIALVCVGLAYLVIILAAGVLVLGASVLYA